MNRLLGMLAVVVVAVGCGRSAPDEAIESTTLVTTATNPPVTTPATTAPATEPQQVTYVIQSGDSLSVVAERFGIRTADLAEFNAIEDVNSIKIGQEIRIPPTAATSSVDPPTTSVAEPTSTSEG